VGAPRGRIARLTAASAAASTPWPRGAIRGRIGASKRRFRVRVDSRATIHTHHAASLRQVPPGIDRRFLGRCGGSGEWYPAVTADLTAGTWAAIRDRPDTAASCPSHVMENLAAFQADSCASTWYGFIVRLALLVNASEIRGLLGELDPFPDVTAQALIDARSARSALAELEAG